MHDVFLKQGENLFIYENPNERLPEKSLSPPVVSVAASSFRSTRLKNDTTKWYDHRLCQLYVAKFILTEKLYGLERVLVARAEEM